MIVSAWEKFAAWWTGSAWPTARAWTIGLLSEWWKDIGSMPRPHFVSMVFGMALLYIVKFMAWLVL